MPRGNVCKYWSNYCMYVQLSFDKYEWKLFDPGVNSATQKNVGEWQEPNLGKSLGVSSLSVSSILHPYTVHTLHDSKTLVNFIHFQNKHGVDWNLDGFCNVSRLVSLNIIFICNQNVFYFKYIYINYFRPKSQYV